MISHRKLKLQFRLLCLFILLQHAFAAHIQLKPQQGVAQQLPQGHISLQAEQQLKIQEHDHPSSILQEKNVLQDAMKTHSVETEYTDPYLMLNEPKQNTHSFPFPPSSPSPYFPFSFPWNPNPYMNQPYPPISPFSLPSFASLPYQGLSNFVPYLSYPPPMFIPYPFYMPPEIFYPAFSDPTNDYDDTMSRAPNGRRSSPQHVRNSPIYYMRLPPTPYMFVPSFGFPSPTTQSNFGTNFQPISSFQAYPTYPNLGSTFNVPVNFLANGKPSGIYQMNNVPNNFGALNNFNIRGPPQPNFNGNYFPTPFGIPNPPPPPHQDSKLTSIKEPFIFNGRPENMYILQNGFNPIYPGI